MKRTVALGAAWTASAAAAVGLGFLAVSFVDASASPGNVPVAATSSPTGSTEPPAAPSSATPSSAAPSSVQPSSLQPTAQQATDAGMVYASCDRGGPEVAGAPAAGWWVDDSDDPGEVEFRNGGQKVEVHVTCTDTGPRFSVEGPRADDGDSSGHGGSDRNDDDNSGHGGSDDSGKDSSGHGGSDDD